MLLSLAFVLLVCGPVLGFVIDRTMMRNLQSVSTGVTLVITIGLLLLLFGLANTVWNQTVTRNLPEFLPNTNVSVAGVAILVRARTLA